MAGLRAGKITGKPQCGDFEFDSGRFLGPVACSDVSYQRFRTAFQRGAVRSIRRHSDMLVYPDNMDTEQHARQSCSGIRYTRDGQSDRGSVAPANELRELVWTRDLDVREYFVGSRLRGCFRSLGNEDDVPA